MLPGDGRDAMCGLNCSAWNDRLPSCLAAPRTLRHAVATHLLQAGIDNGAVRQPLSRNDVSTALICPQMPEVAAVAVRGPLAAPA